MKAQAETQKVGTAPPGGLINTDEAAAWLGMASTTLRRWRSEGRGPRWVRVGSLARYRESDLVAWAEAHVVESGDPPMSAAHEDGARRCVEAVLAAEERDALRVAREALATAHGLLMVAVLATPRPAGPLLEAAVEVADALEALEDEAIESAADVLERLWPPHRVRAALHRAVQAGALTPSEIAAWVVAQTGGSGLEAESALDSLLDVVQAQEVALAEAEAAMEAEWERIVGGERG